MSANDVYDVMMERLKFPSSARLRPILEELMTPDQARMVVELPGTPQEVAEKTGIDLYRVEDALDALFFKGVIFKLSETPGKPRRAPLLGEHNDYVYGEILGMPREEIKHYTEEGVF